MKARFGPLGRARPTLRWTLAALAAAATAGPAGILVPSAPAAVAHIASVVITRRVATPGVYRVTIRVASSAKGSNGVHLVVGPLSRIRVTTSPRRPATVSVQIDIKGTTLTVHAVGHRSRPRLVVRLRRLAGNAHPTPITTTITSPAPNSGASSSPPPAAAPAPSPTPAPTPTPAGDPGNWRTIFFDNFSGSSLDTSKWTEGWFGSGITGPLSPGETECFDPSQVSVGNGELDLSMIWKTETCGGQSRPFASGIVTTNGKFSFTYGFMEARVWVPGTNGFIPDWADVWLDGQTWPTDGEIDIMEVLGNKACWHFHFQPGDAPGGCSNQSFTGGWHLFGADWEPGQVTYYYDGQAVGTITSHITSAPMYIILSLAAANTVDGPATIRFSYVHVWQH